MKDCDTCKHPDKVDEVGGKIDHLAQEIGEDAPCLSAILSSIVLLWIAGDFEAIHALAGGLSIIALMKAAQLGPNTMDEVLDLFSVTEAS